MDYIITGLAAGVGVAIGQILLMRMGGKHLLRPLERALVSGGPEKARALLDAKLPRTKLIAYLKVQQQCERMAGLALLGDVAALEEESAMHRGSLVARSQVGAVALLGIAVRTADPPSAAARLVDLASRTEAEGGIVLAHVKKKVRAYATLAEAMHSDKVSAEAIGQAESVAGEDGGMVRLLVWNAVERAYRKQGANDEAEAYAAKLRLQTTAFERTPPAQPTPPA